MQGSRHENLFVATDGSAFPTIPSAVPHLTVMMPAERVADWLRGKPVNAGAGASAR
jgi:choline dehydrogenase-like flavoprotein